MRRTRSGKKGSGKKGSERKRKAGGGRKPKMSAEQLAAATEMVHGVAGCRVGLPAATIRVLIRTEHGVDLAVRTVRNILRRQMRMRFKHPAVGKVKMGEEAVKALVERNVLHVAHAVARTRVRLELAAPRAGTAAAAALSEAAEERLAKKEALPTFPKHLFIDFRKC